MRVINYFYMRGIKRVKPFNTRKVSNPLRFTANGIVYPRYTRYGANIFAIRRVTFTRFCQCDVCKAIRKAYLINAETASYTDLSSTRR